MPDLLENTHEAARKSLLLAVEMSFANANPEWLREMARCLYIAARENPFVQSDDVNDVFRRRASRLRTKTMSASGKLYLLAERMGVIKRAQRPIYVSVRSNHNRCGTRYWQSLVHEPGYRDESKYDPAALPEIRLPEQTFFDFGALSWPPVLVGPKAEPGRVE